MKKQTEAPKKETVCYVGPTIPNVVVSSTTFKDGVLSPKLEKYIETKPYIANLLIPLDKLHTVMRDLNDKNSALSRFYRLATKNN